MTTLVTRFEEFMAQSPCMASANVITHQTTTIQTFIAEIGVLEAERTSLQPMLAALQAHVQRIRIKPVISDVVEQAITSLYYRVSPYARNIDDIVKTLYRLILLCQRACVAAQPPSDRQ